MYLNFFKFKQEPFSLTPDPRFFFLSDQHLEALETLNYGIENRKGFMVLTGEVGTGKTTICRTLMSRFGSNTEIALVLNSLVSVPGLLKSINRDFGLKVEDSSVENLLDSLHQFLLSLIEKNKNAIVIIDEAQNLSIEALEMTRLLSNLETDTHKLLQVILVGQPELDEKLADYRLRQLAQRISVRSYIGALSFSDACDYIIHRILIAGGDRKIEFEKRALKLIYQSSKGYPRVINNICDRAMLAAFSQKTTKITPKIVKMAVKDLKKHVGKLWGEK